jgi:uncharacterized membrane protein YdjX (TVP38/TMEM64 family)
MERFRPAGPPNPLIMPNFLLDPADRSGYMAHLASEPTLPPSEPVATRRTLCAVVTRAIKLAVVVTLVLTAIIAPFVLFGARFEEWAQALLANGAGVAARVACVLLLAADVVLPVPSSLVSTASGILWGGWIGALLSTLGMTLGSILGYGLGHWAGAGVGRWLGADEELRLRRLHARHGDWTVVVSRPLPVLAEASAVFAGMSRMRFARFVTLSVAANAVVSIFYAALGTLIARRSEAIALPLLVAALAAVAVTIARLAPRAALSPPLPPAPSSRIGPGTSSTSLRSRADSAGS